MQETQETRVRSLGQEDVLEKGMATHSSILTWRILWTEQPGGLYIVHGVRDPSVHQDQVTAWKLQPSISLITSRLPELQTI